MYKFIHIIVSKHNIHNGAYATLYTYSYSNFMLPETSCTGNKKKGEKDLCLFFFISLCFNIFNFTSVLCIAKKGRHICTADTHTPLQFAPHRICARDYNNYCMHTVELSLNKTAL